MFQSVFGVTLMNKVRVEVRKLPSDMEAVSFMLLSRSLVKD